MRQATARDIEVLVGLMAEFYGEAGYALNPEHAAAAFAAVLADERLGSVWILEPEPPENPNQAAGHAVLTLRFAMEYGGIIACLDDLYVRPAWRNRGLATASLRALADFCRERGYRALTVEVGAGNEPARAAYRRAGFVEAADRRMLALALAAPTHL